MRREERRGEERRALLLFMLCCAALRESTLKTKLSVSVFENSSGRLRCPSSGAFLNIGHTIKFISVFFSR